MKAEKDILGQFETLETLEVSPEWNEHMLRCLAQSRPPAGKTAPGVILSFIIVILLTVNFLTFSKGWSGSHEKKNDLMLKEIATEFLVFSDSSKF